MTHDLTVDRRIAATPGACFDAFVAMYASDRPGWITDSELDLRPGGEWTVRFHTPGNEPFRERRLLTDVDRPALLGYDATVTDDDGTERFTTHLRLSCAGDPGGGTVVALTQSGFPTEADRDEFAGAWPDVLDLLEQRAGRSGHRPTRGTLSR